MKAMILVEKAYSARAFEVVEVNLGVGAKENVMEAVTVASFEVAWALGPFVGSGGAVIAAAAVARTAEDSVGKNAAD